MSKEIFDPEHLSLNKLFIEKVNYVVPSYQRPYSWESLGKNDTNNQINNMWDDFISFFENNPEKEYFFGSIVVFHNGNNESEVVDGQQRLTSLLLFFSAMKCFLMEYENKIEELDEESTQVFKEFIKGALNTLNNLIFNKESGIGFKQNLKLKIERASGFDFDSILNQAINCDDKFETLKEIKLKYKVIAERYFDTRNYLKEKLKERFLDDGIFTRKKAEELDYFAEFLRTKISVVVIKTVDFDTAYSIFEVLNNRGLPLSTKDLFRNFIIKQFSDINEKDPESKWDFLEESYDVTSDFLGRFVESKKSSQPQKSAFNELKDYYNKLDKSLNENKIELFYKDIEKNLGYYTKITNENNIDNEEIRNKIKFIKLLGNVRYSYSFLMSVFRYFNKENIDEIIDILSIYEQHRLYFLLAPSKRFSSTKTYQAIKSLNQKELEKSKEILRLTEKEKEKLKSLIDGNIFDNQVAKLLLSKYFYTNSSDELVNQYLNYKKASLEHILPQNPDKNSDWLELFDEDFIESFTYKLGNMTLLTHNMNAKVKNYSFSKKRLDYKKTILEMTKELCRWETVTENKFDNRHKRIVKSICEDIKIN
ncbi:MAG: Unknown protein [uncultured Campylobacterales bacterium]|uniref:DUF262 domain-containing protein n=1 Tax=uncultured Campylobacterales bacterium TaxID=352960 RepID=A0A6S6T8R3_9BACT|nr:MAG: Unknown protein [uncultured Campylobacterales bacterium]